MFIKENDHGFWATLGKTCGCHQLKERSFHFRGKQMFVCSRCFGIIVGYIIISPVFYFLKLNLGFYSILLLIPLIIDGSIQHFKILTSTNIRRLITGLLGGIGLGLFIINLILYIIKLF
jgi:uncharacterized membrane protein